MAASNASTIAATNAGEREVVITRVFDAPRELVFEAWTKAAHLSHWFGPNGFTVPSCEVDFRVGGVFRLCMRSPEGEDFWSKGIYREIVAPDKLKAYFG